MDRIALYADPYTCVYLVHSCICKVLAKQKNEMTAMIKCSFG